MSADNEEERIGLLDEEQGVTTGIEETGAAPDAPTNPGPPTKSFWEIAYIVCIEGCVPAFQ